MSTESLVERFIIDELLLGNRTLICPDESLINSQILDSLALLRPILFLEEQFGVTLEDVEVIPDNFQTINYIKSFIANKQTVR